MAASRLRDCSGGRAARCGDQMGEEAIHAGRPITRLPTLPERRYARLHRGGPVMIRIPRRLTDVSERGALANPMREAGRRDQHSRPAAALRGARRRRATRAAWCFPSRDGSGFRRKVRGLRTGALCRRLLAVEQQLGVFMVHLRLHSEGQCSWRRLSVPISGRS
jgi:hypothetical protein